MNRLMKGSLCCETLLNSLLGSDLHVYVAIAQRQMQIDE